MLAVTIINLRHLYPRKCPCPSPLLAGGHLPAPPTQTGTMQALPCQCQLLVHQEPSAWWQGQCQGGRGEGAAGVAMKIGHLGSPLWKGVKSFNRFSVGNDYLLSR